MSTSPPAAPSYSSAGYDVALRFNEDFSRFGHWLQQRMFALYTDGAPAPVITFETGKRYIRIVRTDGPSRSSYGFIDQTTGDLLKCASWKAPAKGVRGHISDPAPACCQKYSLR